VQIGFSIVERSQLFIRPRDETLFVSRCASAIQIVRSLESIVETKAQLQTALSDHGASFGFSANVLRRRRANHGANPKAGQEGRRMNDAQILVLIHAISWPALIWLLSKTWNHA